MARQRPRLSLIEFGLIVCIIGSVAAVFIPTFVGQLRTNKIAEASTLLDQLYERTASYYGARTDRGLTHCLPAVAGPTPAAPSAVPEVVDFFSEAHVGSASWKALGFQPDRPVRYSYSFEPRTHGCGLTGDGEQAYVTLVAQGDLDGDGIASRFERRATIDKDGRLMPVEPFLVHQRVE